MEERVVSHYQILEKVGEGGMGQVFKGRDTRLNRFVALKVLPPSKVGDPERRRRFFQEAQAASALNHPNIVTIYDVVSEQGFEILVMEYVSGATLDMLIPKNGLNVSQILKYSVQMADALSAAHAVGIVHRDLKPGNVMVTESGLVKLLDFGLAKLMYDPNVPSDSDVTQTYDAPRTVEGTILGTASYMSPEQAEGRKVDARSDIFSFGVVLYEMATGRRAFQGNSNLSTLSAVLRDEPQPLAEISQGIPPELDRLIGRCLRKDPDRRWQNMRDILVALAELKEESDSGALLKSRLSVTGMPVMAPAPSPLQAPPSFQAQMPVEAPPPFHAQVPSQGPPSFPGQMPMHQGQMPVQAPPPGGPPAAKKMNILVPILGAGVLLLAAAAGGAWWFFNRPPAEQPPVAAAPPPEPVEPAPAPPSEPLATAPEPPTAPAEQVLNNDSIIEMVKAKLSQSLIVSQIRTAKTGFDLSTPEVIRLAKAGVPESIIAVMRNPKAPFPGGASNQAPPPAAKGATSPPPATTPIKPPSPPPSTVAVAPAPAPVPTPTSVVPRPAAPAPKVEMMRVKLPDGMPLALVITEVTPGPEENSAVVKLTVSSDFKVGDTVLIAKGARATATISEAQKRRFLGRGARYFMKLGPVDAVDGQKIPLRPASIRKPDEEGKPVEVTLQKEKDRSTLVPKGREHIAYIDGGGEVSVPKK